MNWPRWGSESRCGCVLTAWAFILQERAAVQLLRPAAVLVGDCARMGYGRCTDAASVRWSRRARRSVLAAPSPAVGPAWVGVVNAPRNAMPSLHMTWALLALWYSPRRLLWASAVSVRLTALATVGLGEHYLIDLAAAVPFTWAVVKLAATSGV